MIPNRQISRLCSGVSLLELVIVIAVISVLSGGGMILYQNFAVQQTQAQVESALDAVATAQLSYLQNNPTKTYTDITSISVISPYLPNQALPAVLSGYSLVLTISPPVAIVNGKAYRAHQ